MQGKQKLCLHQLTQASSLMVSQQIGHFELSEESGSGMGGTWLVLAAEVEALVPGNSSSGSILHCKRKRHKAHDLP